MLSVTQRCGSHRCVRHRHKNAARNVQKPAKKKKTSVSYAYQSGSTDQARYITPTERTYYHYTLRGCMNTQSNPAQSGKKIHQTPPDIGP
jgi:hypothetical protein